MSESSAARFDRLDALRGVAIVWMALFHLMLGDLEHTFAWLNRGVDERSDLMHSIRTNPFFTSAWQDPRFAAVLQRMRLGPPLAPPTQVDAVS